MIESNILLVEESNPFMEDMDIVREFLKECDMYTSEIKKVYTIHPTIFDFCTTIDITNVKEVRV